ncbi:MAG: ABC transporter permease [Ignavibacteriae bacterium]|nr:ABC transporter permease [Ignavibacteriota bacterium]
MKNIFLLVKKDLLRFIIDKPSVLLTFLVPAVLIVIFGSIFGGGSKSRGKIPIIVVNESKIELANFLESEFDSSSSLRSVKSYRDEEGKIIPITHKKAKELITSGKYPAALIIPNNFFSDSSSGLNFKFYYDPRNEIETQLIQGTIQKTIFTKIPKIFPLLMQRKAQSFLGDTKLDTFNMEIATLISDNFGVDKEEILESFTNFNITKLIDAKSSDSTSDDGAEVIKSLIDFESQQLVGKGIKNPGVTRMVGGWAIMFLLFTLTGAATSIFEERQEGTLKRLFCMPIAKKDFLFSKYIYSILLGVVQLSILFLFAYFLYDVDIFSNLFNLVIVIFVSASAAVAFAMIITASTKSLAQANGISTLFILIMSALGGSWFPVTLFPDWMQVISKFTLTYWSVDAFLQVLWREAPLQGIIFPHITVLLCIAFVANYIAIHLFKKRQVM